MKARLKGRSRLHGALIGAAVLGLALAQAACQRARNPSDAMPMADAEVDADGGYAAPPVVVSAQRVGDQVVINGRAEANGRLRLQTPEGAAFGGTAGADGGWSMPAPAVNAPRLYAVGEDVGDHILRAEGYVAALPSGRPAALLRAGAGSLALDAAAHHLAIGAVDYDGAGYAFVSGMAPPGAALRLQIDANPSMEVKADATGRFTLALKANELPAGTHHLVLISPDATAVATVAIDAPSPISTTVFQGRREGSAWRIDWRTPGGGVQTSLILDP